MFAPSPAQDYLSAPPYIVTVDRPQGLEAKACPSLAEAVICYFTDFCADCHTHIVDARGAAIIAIRPGGGVLGFAATGEVFNMIRYLLPNEDIVDFEMLDLEWRVLRGEELP